MGLQNTAGLTSIVTPPAATETHLDQPSVPRLEALTSRACEYCITALCMNISYMHYYPIIDLASLFLGIHLETFRITLTMGGKRAKRGHLPSLCLHLWLRSEDSPWKHRLWGGGWDSWLTSQGWPQKRPGLLCTLCWPISQCPGPCVAGLPAGTGADCCQHPLPLCPALQWPLPGIHRPYLSAWLPCLVTWKPRRVMSPPGLRALRVLSATSYIHFTVLLT